MEGGIAAAVGEIVRLHGLNVGSRAMRLRQSRAIIAIDLALEELEQLKLADYACIPEEVARRIVLLLRSVPPELRPRLEGNSVEVLMDDLYGAQRSLLVQRSGPEWDALRASEDELLPSA